MTNSTLVRISNSVLSTSTLIALVALKGYNESKKGKQLYIEDLSDYLMILKAKGIDISRIALSISAGKYWSEDIAQFVAEGIVLGDIKHNSPIVFTDRCRDVCENALAKYSSQDSPVNDIVEKARNILSV